MSRRISRDTRTKIRNVQRHIRALELWARTIEHDYPENYSSDNRYWNIKIPVLDNLVEGKYSTMEIKIACIRSMINACHRLMTIRPEGAAVLRTTCVICLPDLFSSEICFYFSEEYYLGHTSESSNSFGFSKVIRDRSLAKELGLTLPPGVGEIGKRLQYDGFDDPDDHFIGERWYYGDVG